LFPRSNLIGGNGLRKRLCLVLRVEHELRLRSRSLETCRKILFACVHRVGIRVGSCLYCKVKIGGAFCSTNGGRANFAQRQTPGRRLFALQMLPLRLLITAAVLCHLLVAPTLVTSQLLPSS